MLRTFTPYVLTKVLHEKEGYYYDKRRGLFIYGDEPYSLEEGETCISVENHHPAYSTYYIAKEIPIQKLSLTHNEWVMSFSRKESVDLTFDLPDEGNELLITSTQVRLVNLLIKRAIAKHGESKVLIYLRAVFEQCEKNHSGAVVVLYR